MYRCFLKRAMDICLSALGLIILSPVFAIVAILVRSQLGSPVIFKQARLGKGKKVFLMYKFRSMTAAKDAEGNLLPDEVRLTSFGKLLRSTSLDELPELWNILKGEMSVIGPRPLPDYYRDYYTVEEHRRHEVRGGLTGYAQVSGRNYVKWEKKFEQDVYYVDHYNLLMDIKIFLKTIVIAFKRDNIETASQVVHAGVVYQPLNVERKDVHTTS